MCGRVTLKTPAEAIAEQFGYVLDDLPPLPPRYNIAPTQDLLAIRASRADARAGASASASPPRPTPALVRWGLVPHWAPDLSVGNRMINARAETIFEKSAFRDAIRGRRCLIVVDGFYEWRRSRKDSQPFYFRMRDGRPFALAGLRARWRSPEGASIETCTIVTTGANALLSGIHDRMPAILGPGAQSLWLDPAIEGDRATDAALGPLLVPYPADLMDFHPVSQRVNRPDVDDPACVEAVAAAPLPPAGEPREQAQQSLFPWG